MFGSTYERWVAEVNSGLLREGILHTEKFWKEHARQLEDEEFRMLRVLARLLDSEDETVQGIVLNDLGEFARFYPNGRMYVIYSCLCCVLLPCLNSFREPFYSTQYFKDNRCEGQGDEHARPRI